MRLDPADDSLLLATCVGPPEPRSQLFDLSGLNRIRPGSNLNKCFQAGVDGGGAPTEGTPVIVADCDASKPYQKFTFNASSGGPIRLAFIPEYCVAYSSDPPILDSEPLVISLCENSNEWEVRTN